MAIVPDKFININIRKHQALTRIKSTVGSINTAIYGQELDDVAMKCYEEYEMNMKGVIETFNQFIFQYECGDKVQNDVANDLARMLRLKFRNNAPRRPPKVMLIGPPGSGRST